MYLGLKYDEEDTNIVETTYTQDNINTLLDKVKILENKYQLKYISSLSTNISRIMSDIKEAEKILPKDIEAYGGYETVKKDTATYYQYSQFKRLHFKCITSETKYNTGTGRITYIKFECTNKFG